MKQTYPCAHCRRPIQPTNTAGRPRLCCSRSCKEKLKQWRRRHVRNLMRHASSPTQRDCADYKRAMMADPCAHCGNRAQALDHITPRVLDGPHGWENLAGTCHVCNSSKNDRSLLAFMLRRRIDDELVGLTRERALLA